MCTVWSAETLIGQTALEADVGPDGAHAGLFKPTPAFESVRVVFERLGDAQRRLADLVAGLRGAAPGSIRAELQRSGVGDLLLSCLSEIDGLQLEVRSPDGVRLPCSRVFITQVPIPLLELTDEQRAEARANLEEAGMTLEGPNYLIVALPIEGGSRSEGSGATLPSGALPR